MAIELKLAHANEPSEMRGLRGLMRRLFARETTAGRTARVRESRNRRFEPRGFYDRQEQRYFESALARSRETAKQEGGFL